MTPASIGGLLAAACLRYRERPALVRRGETATYGEVLERGARLANAPDGRSEVVDAAARLAGSTGPAVRLITIGAAVRRAAAGSTSSWTQPVRNSNLTTVGG